MCSQASCRGRVARPSSLLVLARCRTPTPLPSATRARLKKRCVHCPLFACARPRPDPVCLGLLLSCRAGVVVGRSARSRGRPGNARVHGRPRIGGGPCLHSRPRRCHCPRAPRRPGRRRCRRRCCSFGWRCRRPVWCRCRPRPRPGRWQCCLCVCGCGCWCRSPLFHARSRAQAHALALHSPRGGGALTPGPTCASALVTDVSVQMSMSCLDWLWHVCTPLLVWLLLPARMFHARTSESMVIGCLGWSFCCWMLSTIQVVFARGCSFMMHVGCFPIPT